MDKEIENYFIDREEEEQPVFAKLLDDLKKNFSDDLLDALPSLSFIMLKPDAYLRGLVPSVLTFLKENNVYPVHYRLKQLDAAEIDELYMFVKPKYIESWWIMDKTYRLAPCCPVIVVGKKENYDHLSLRIRSLVGPTTPTLGDESNIRYKFRGAHRIFNMIHGTDDPAAAIREALVFFSLDDLRDALNAAKKLERGIDDPSCDLQHEHLVPNEVVQLDLQIAKYNLKRALLHRWTTESSSVREMLGNTSKFIGVLKRLRDIGDRLEKLLETEKEIIVELTSPRERKSRLRNLYYYELRSCSLAQDAIQQLMLSISRESLLEREVRTAAMSRLAPIEKCIEMSRALTMSVEFKECPFDNYLSWVRFLDIELDSFDEANLHAAWSVAATEFVDFELKFPEEP